MNKILIASSSFALNSKEALHLMDDQGFDISLNPHARKLNRSELIDVSRKISQSNQLLKNIGGIIYH
jgi:hypothetical protein